MAAGAGRDPAAERRELEALRIVADREAVRFQRRLDRRAANAALDARGAARAVHLEHAVEMAHVEADRAGVSVADAGSTPPTTEEPPPNGMTATFAPPAQSSTASMSASLFGRATRVGRVGEVAAKRAHGFGKGLAVGMEEPLVGVLRQHAGERGGRRDAGRAERDLGGLRRRSGGARLDAELARRRSGRDARARPSSRPSPSLPQP